jgi:hypothetical protein
MFPTCCALISGIFHEFSLFWYLILGSRKIFVSVFNFAGATVLEKVQSKIPSFGFF